MALARTRSLEEVASLIWTGRFDTSASATPSAGRGAHARRRRPALRGRAPSRRSRARRRSDATPFDLRPRHGRAAPDGGFSTCSPAPRPARTPARRDDRSGAGPGLGSAGAAASTCSAPRSILCADHELNVSSFTARCVASAGSNPYAVVIAGLAALEGTRHGGASARVESMLASLRAHRAICAARSPRGCAGARRSTASGTRSTPAAIPRGDHADRSAAPAPRAIARSWPSSWTSPPRPATPCGERPNLDFALAALARVLRLPAASPLALFAIGRTIGWIGHAIEQYATGQLIRPRAKYVGVVPAA